MDTRPHSDDLSRFRLLAAVIGGSALAAVFGVMIAIETDTVLISCPLAAALPVFILAGAGLCNVPQLLKVAGYAVVGWSLCYALGPSVTQTASSRAARIAADPLLGHWWVATSYAASCAMASAGVLFLPHRILNRQI